MKSREGLQERLGFVDRRTDMGTARYVYWQDAGDWLGYFEDYPDYLTEGDSLEDLQEHL